MHPAQAPPHDDSVRAITYLRPLGKILNGALDGLTVTERAPSGLSPYLRLVLPDAEPLRIYLGGEWYWGDNPHEMIAPIGDVYRAAREIIGRLQAAQRRALIVICAGPVHGGRPTW